MRSFTGRCFGTGRGTILTMRYCGIVPAASRVARLRMRFLSALSDKALPGERLSLAARVYKSAVTDRHSRLKQLISSCPAYSESLRLAQDFRQAYRRARNELPPLKIELAIRSRAQSVTLRCHAWRKHEAALKLLHLQPQDYAQPHPVAYLAHPDAVMVGRWLVNHIPGRIYPCHNCDGAYAVSRYHMARCTNVAALLGPAYDPVAYAIHFNQVDTVLDAMILDLVPPESRREQLLLYLNNCPGVRRLPPAQPPTPPGLEPIADLLRAPPRIALLEEPPPPWRDPHWRVRVLQLGHAVAELWRLCRPPDDEPGQASLPAPDLRGSSLDAQSDPVVGTPGPDPDLGHDRVVPHAFPPTDGAPEGVITAEGRRASSSRERRPLQQTGGRASRRLSSPPPHALPRPC